MFCTNCGKENESDAVYCIECGHEMNEASSKKINLKIPDITIKNKKAVTAVAAVVLLVLVGSFVFGRRSYKKTINLFVKYSTPDKMDIMKMYDELVPAKVMDYARKESETSRSEFKKEMKKLEEDAERNYKQIEEQYDVKMKDIKISYKIAGAETLKGDDLADIKDLYKDDIGLKVSAAKQIEVELTIHIDKDTEFTNSMDVDLIKVGRSWYLDLPTMGGLDSMF